MGRSIRAHFHPIRASGTRPDRIRNRVAPEAASRTLWIMDLSDGELLRRREGLTLGQPLPGLAGPRELVRPETRFADVRSQRDPGGLPEQSRLPVVLVEQVLEEVGYGMQFPLLS